MSSDERDRGGVLEASADGYINEVQEPEDTPNHSGIPEGEPSVSQELQTSNNDGDVAQIEPEQNQPTDANPTEPETVSPPRREYKDATANKDIYRELCLQHRRKLSPRLQRFLSHLDRQHDRQAEQEEAARIALGDAYIPPSERPIRLGDYTYGFYRA